MFGSTKPGKEETDMEAAHVLTWEGFEIDEERGPARSRKAGDRLYLVPKPEPQKKDHAYSLGEGFTL
jgi:hypothetical protein